MYWSFSPHLYCLSALTTMDFGLHFWIIYEVDIAVMKDVNSSLEENNATDEDHTRDIWVTANISQGTNSESERFELKLTSWWSLFLFAFISLFKMLFCASLLTAVISIS